VQNQCARQCDVRFLSCDAYVYQNNHGEHLDCKGFDNHLCREINFENSNENAAVSGLSKSFRVLSLFYFPLAGSCSAFSSIRSEPPPVTALLQGVPSCPSPPPHSTDEASGARHDPATRSGHGLWTAPCRRVPRSVPCNPASARFESQ